MQILEVPLTIVFDKDTQYMSCCKKTLWKLIGTKLKFFLTYHQQLDGYGEVANRRLGNLL